MSLVSAWRQLLMLMLISGTNVQPQQTERLSHGSLGPHKFATKWHFDRFIRFCMAHGCAQHTDRQTQTMESANCVAMLHLCDMQCSELGITSCYSTGSQTPHRCCHPANNVEHVKYVDHLHVWACPTTGTSSSAPSPEGSGLSPNTWFVGPT